MTDAIRNLAALNLGELAFDGSRHTTTGMAGARFAYATLHIPDPIPPEWLGKMSAISAYAAMGGDPPAWKHMTLSKTLGDFSAERTPFGANGLTATVRLTFGAAEPYTVTVQPGEVWYVNIENRGPDMRSRGGPAGECSCGPGKSCNFSMDVGAPS